MRYWMVSDAALHWSLPPQQVRALCRAGRVRGARCVDGLWLIPPAVWPE